MKCFMKTNVSYTSLYSVVVSVSAVAWEGSGLSLSFGNLKNIQWCWSRMKVNIRKGQGGRGNVPVLSVGDEIGKRA